MIFLPHSLRLHDFFVWRLRDFFVERFGDFFFVERLCEFCVWRGCVHFVCGEIL